MGGVLSREGFNGRLLPGADSARRLVPGENGIIGANAAADLLFVSIFCI